MNPPPHPPTHTHTHTQIDLDVFRDDGRDTQQAGPEDGSALEPSPSALQENSDLITFNVFDEIIVEPSEPITLRRRWAAGVGGQAAMGSRGRGAIATQPLSPACPVTPRCCQPLGVLSLTCAPYYLCCPSVGSMFKTSQSRERLHLPAPTSHLTPPRRDAEISDPVRLPERERRFLGCVRVPLSAVYQMQVLEGTFKLEAPPVVLGYVQVRGPWGGGRPRKQLAGRDVRVCQRTKGIKARRTVCVRVCVGRGNGGNGGRRLAAAICRRSHFNSSPSFSPRLLPFCLCPHRPASGPAPSAST